ncbi:MAG TPA: hypothetical protein VG408_10765 [Actinomycetota bacterium]|nr:hypothetical protein [Actinomycetota bacterium]
MRTKLFAAVSAALLLTAIVLTAWPATAAETERYRIAFRSSEFHEIDNNADGDVDDGGDQETGGFVLKKAGDKVGHFNFICVNSEETPPRDLCWATVRITNKGTVTIHGAGRNNADSFLGAITGGTGAYRGASGVFELDFGRRSTLTLRIG